jgi:hypothetical protein
LRSDKQSKYESAFFARSTFANPVGRYSSSILAILVDG